MLVTPTKNGNGNFVADTDEQLNSLADITTHHILIMAMKQIHSRMCFQI